MQRKREKPKIFILYYEIDLHHLNECEENITQYIFIYIYSRYEFRSGEKIITLIINRDIT